MKLHQSIIALLAAVLLTACQSTYKPFATSVITADRAFDGWADYVVWSKKQPTYDAAQLASEEARVRTLYAQWQQANEAVYRAQKAYADGTMTDKTALQRAASAAAAASGNVVEVILSFLPAERAAKLKQAK